MENDIKQAIYELESKYKRIITILLHGPFLDTSSGTLSFTWMTKTSSSYNISFNYDRAVITLSLPDTVKI